MCQVCGWADISAQAEAELMFEEKLAKAHSQVAKR